MRCRWLQFNASKAKNASQSKLLKCCQNQNKKKSLLFFLIFIVSLWQHLQRWYQWCHNLYWPDGNPHANSLLSNLFGNTSCSWCMYFYYYHTYTILNHVNTIFSNHNFNERILSNNWVLFTVSDQEGIGIKMVL